MYKERIASNINRRYLLAYCHSHFIREREYMYNLFVQKSKQCHALGNCCGNHPETKLEKVEGGWGGMQLMNMYTNYKFVLAMENKIHKGYITEKIINAFYSGAIPIYWGCNSVVQYFIQKMSEEPIYMDNEITHLIDDEWNAKKYNKTLQLYVNKLSTFLE